VKSECIVLAFKTAKSALSLSYQRNAADINTISLYFAFAYFTHAILLYASNQITVSFIRCLFTDFPINTHVNVQTGANAGQVVCPFI
jgi:hypothetical protein